MVELPARIAFLKKIHLFYGLDDEELMAVADQLNEASYSAGAVIFQQDTKAESLYFIYTGNVKIVRRREGKERALATLVAGDYFGEMALIEKRKRSGTATAVTDSLLLILSREHFEQLLKSAPHLRLNFEIAVQSRRLAGTLQFKWLAPDEVIYFLARKHRVILYRMLVLPILSFIVPAMLYYGYFEIARFKIVLFAAILSTFAVIAWIFWQWVDWGNDYYIMTNRRVVWLEKVVGLYDSRLESPLSTILSVGVETDALGRAMDYGNLIVRTFVARIPFDHVGHPDQARRMIEEYWSRTREQAVGLEKEAMKNAIRKRLGIVVPAKPAPPPLKPADFPRKRTAFNLLRYLGLSALKLRYEQGENVIYRKHWFVLFKQAWIPILGELGVIGMFLYRVFDVLTDGNPNTYVIKNNNGSISIDGWLGALVILFVPLLAWIVYEVADWSNDKFEVTNDQIIDLDKKPFGTQTRSAAQLENILATEYKRIGILGEIFNYGTVYITVGGTKMAFEDVMNPAAVQTDIDRRRMARVEKKNQAAVTAERERMAEWLATYHNSAAEFRREEEKKNNPKPE
ncbi:MAG TPA: cyclic nucleotide-binding domain-containing protein [Anaerolineales bacterium]|nr:cyclic nucleotide-binding domain-containing protein [Anaerolineales bacterium]